MVSDTYQSISRDFSDKPRDLARLLTISTKESGAWLHVLPAVLGNLSYDNFLRRTAVLPWGAIVCSRHDCRCGAVVEKTGYPGLGGSGAPEE